MRSFDELLRPKTFDDLLVKDPPVVAEPETTKVTSSLGQPMLQAPKSVTMPDIDTSLYISDELPALIDLKEPGQREEVKEKVHHDYFVSEAAQRAIDAAARKQPVLSQGSTSNTPQRINPKLLKPRALEKGGSAEYLIDKISNETLLGKASILMAGTIQAAAHGGNPVDYYRDIYDDNNQTIMGYKPNVVQDMATSTLAVVIDWPFFEGAGQVYNQATGGALKYATKYTADKLVQAGSTRVLADKYAANGVMKLNAMVQSGSVLGSYSGLNDVATQLSDGASLGEVNWNQVLETGGTSGILGMGLGAFGIGSNYIRNQPYFTRMADGAAAKRLVQRGVQKAAPGLSLGGEVTTFTLGQSMLDSGRRWHETKPSDWLDNLAIVGGLKMMHSGQKLPVSRGKFSMSEQDAIRKYTKDLSTRDPLRSLVEQGKIEDILNDPKTPYSLKWKISQMAGIDAQMPLVSDVTMEGNANGAIVRTYDRNKNLLQTERFNSEAEAYPFFKDMETGQWEMARLQETSSLTAKNQMELDRRVEKAGIEGGISNEMLVYSLSILPSERSPEAKKMANSFYEVYDAFKAEKLEVKEGEKPEKLFKEELAPEPTIDVKEVAEAAKEAVRPYTQSEIDKKFEPSDRLQINITHERFGIDKMLSDLQEIKKTKNYKEGSIRSKTIQNYFPEMTGETLPIKSAAEAANVEKILKAAKKSTEKEIARREEAGESEVGQGNFVMGRKGFETKAELFKELDKFESLENTLPEIIDFDTMLAVKEYETSRYGRGKEIAQDIKAAAEKVRKGKIDPNQAMATVPGFPQAWNLTVEMVAKAMEGGATAGEAISRAIKGVRNTTHYKDLSDIEKSRLEMEIMRKYDQQQKDKLDEDIIDQKPPKTSTQKKIDQSLRRPISKKTVNEYIALKDQIKGQARIARDIAKFQGQAREDIKAFMNTVDWQQSMGKRASKTIARKLAGIDVNKPGSVVEAMDYIERAVKDAKFREELVELDRAYEKIDKQTSPESYEVRKSGETIKGKGIDPTYTDKLKVIRKNMLEGSWKDAQEKIDKLQESLGEYGDPKNEAILDQIDALSFHGLLNETGVQSLGYLKSKLEDIESIRKEGRTLRGAKQFITAAENAARVSAIFNVMNAHQGAKGIRKMLGARTKQVVLGADKRQHLNTPMYDKASRFMDWTDLDSWFTLMNKMSRNDKSTGQYRSDLSRIMGDYVMTSEHNEFVSKSEQKNIVSDKGMEIFGARSPKELRKILDNNTRETHILKFEDQLGKDQTVKVTMNEAYKRWMEFHQPSLKSNLTRMGFFDKFGEKTSKYEAVENLLTPEVKKWAEWQMKEFYKQHRGTVNPVYRDVFGTDMADLENYSPIFVEGVDKSGKDVAEAMLSNMDFRSLGGNGHLKSRSVHSKELSWVDGDKVLMNYIDKMEFFKAWAKPLREMNRVWNHPDIIESMRQNFGQDYVKNTKFFMDKFSRKPEEIHKFEKATTYIRKNFTLGSLALKPTVFVKQLLSVPAYMDRIPVTAFASGMKDIANPAKWKEIVSTLNESVYLQERYKTGWDRDITLSMKAIQKDASSMISKRGTDFKNAMMFNVKYGDKGAILAGGWPVYKHHLNKSLKAGMTPEKAKEVAMREFEFATRQSQQASGVADLSVIQNSNPIMKVATMYATSPIQYHRKAITAARDLMLDKRSPMESAKTLAIYHVILPQIFELISNGFKWDGDEQLRALKWGNFSYVPVAGDALKGVIDGVSDAYDDYQLTPLEDMVDITARAIKDISKVDLDDITYMEILGAMKNVSKTIGFSTGLPVQALYNTTAGVTSVINNDTQYPARKILGWSDYALENDNYDLLKDLPADMRAMILKNLNDDTKSWDDLMKENNEPKTFDDLLKKN